MIKNIKLFWRPLHNNWVLRATFCQTISLVTMSKIACGSSIFYIFFFLNLVVCIWLSWSWWLNMICVLGTLEDTSRIWILLTAAVQCTQCQFLLILSTKNMLKKEGRGSKNFQTSPIGLGIYTIYRPRIFYALPFYMYTFFSP